MATKDDEPPAKPESKTRQQIVEWFSVTNPDMWISIGVVVIVLVVVSTSRPAATAQGPSEKLIPPRGLLALYI